MNIDIFIKGPLPFLSVNLYLRITSNCYCTKGSILQKLIFKRDGILRLKYIYKCDSLILNIQPLES